MHYESGMISIIVPVYNTGKYLNRCMESILNQTYHNIEVIIINDGSNDGSGELCDRWGRKDNRIRVFHKSNGGAASARNLGLDMIQGEFVGFVDSDDYIKPDMYANLYACMEDTIDITCCGTAILYPSNMNRKSEFYGKALRKQSFSSKEAINELLRKRYLSFSPCDKLYRRELIERIRFPIGKECEDLPMIYETLKHSRKIVNIGKVEYLYCYRENSSSRKSFDIKRMSYVLFARDILQDVMKNYPDEKKTAEALYIRNIVAVIQEIDSSNNKCRYESIRRRLHKVLSRMGLRIAFNPYIPEETKKDIMGELLL